MLALFSALTLVGCASKSTEIAPTYVSPVQYQSYSCVQLSEEAQRVSAAAATATGVQDKQATSESTTELSEKPAAKLAKDQLNAKDLALTKDASDIDYKALVEQLGFQSKANVKSVCGELSANLKAQRWTKESSDLITPASAILKRKRGDAELTIFVKPNCAGSEVKMITEGLAWDEK